MENSALDGVVGNGLTGLQEFQAKNCNILPQYDLISEDLTMTEFVQ